MHNGMTASENGTAGLPMPAARIATLLGGELKGAVPPILGTLRWDSREVEQGDVFVALHGSEMDGHAFISEAMARGAGLLVIDDEARLQGIGLTVPYILVPDTNRALGKAAHDYLRELHAPVVGITGSAGKTTTKELTAHLLSGTLRVGMTHGNFNTITGVPQSVLMTAPPIDVFVAEVAMSQHGEIRELCEVISPDIGVLLNVGRAHIGLLGSQENIAHAKGEIFEALPASGHAVCNSDDPLARGEIGRSRAPVVWFGCSEGADIRGSILSDPHEPLRLAISDSSQHITAETSFLGHHYAYNVLAAVAVGRVLGVPLSALGERLATFSVPGQRGTILQTRGGAILIDDSYNSSTPAVIAALEVLGSASTADRIAVIGDMLELGAFAQEDHEAVGRKVAGTATRLLAVGEYSESVARGAREAGMSPDAIVCVGDADEACHVAADWDAPNVTFLVKGSHGVHLERIVSALVGGGA